MIKKSQWRALIVAASMCMTAGLTVLATPTKRLAVVGGGLSLDLAVPQAFGGWVIDTSIVPIAPSPDLQKVIDETYSQTLSRTYRSPGGYRIMLSMAIGDQVRGMDIHRPEVCYPAQGFEIRKDTETINWSFPERSIPVRMLVAGNGPRNEPISYWIVVGDQVAAYGLQHRLATLKYGLTGSIPDGILIRVSSIDRDEPRAYAEQQRFVNDLLAGVGPEFRKRLMGAL